MATIARGKAADRFLFISLILTIIFLSPQFLLGATAPDVTRLLTMPGQTFSGRVASDTAGNIYIADTLNNKIRVYNYQGVLKRSTDLKYTPTALAVSHDNLLCVGENAHNGHYYVEAFSANGELVRTMNATDPVAMAFLSTGELYMVDGYNVKKFDAAMNQVMEFGGYNMFRDPSALAISEQKGEIYVLDMGAVATEGSYSNTPVWRVQVFDLSGKPLRNFSSYGYGVDGRVGSASGIAVDKDGRIYVSDNVQPIIAVFDENGVFLKTIYEQASPLYNLANISYGNDRLYIASLAGNFAAVYAVGAYAQLDVTPNALDITWQQGMSAPSKVLKISNSGTADLTWNAAVDAASSSWLSISQGTGTVAANSTQDVTVTINTAGFTAGQTFTGTIDITSSGGSPTVSVKVTVAAQPSLTVSPATIDITRKSSETTAPIPITITIGNEVSPGALTWHAAVASDAGWLRMSPPEGTSGLALAPLVTFDAVAPGTYSGSITVTLDGAVGSPVTIPVSLKVLSSSKIVVTTNNDDASFTISGPSETPFSGTGRTYSSADGIAAGSYTITYKRVPGFKTPPSETKTIVVGEDATFVGTYSDLRQKMDIVASHGFRKGESNEVVIFRGDGTSANVRFVPALPYSYGVSTAVGDLDGDGVMDILVGGAPAIVKGYTRAGDAISGLEFSAYETPRRGSAGGVNLAAADFDADHRDEIITGDAKNSSVVRVFSFDGTSVTDTGFYIEPFKNLGEGVNVAAADVDGDGLPELVALQANSDVVPEVKIYKVNTAAGTGRWTADMTGRFKVCNTAAETALAAADVDGDGIADIVVICRSGERSEVREFSGSGTLIASFTAATNAGSLAAGDTNFDATAEIILGDTASTGSKTFSILDPHGSTSTINAFIKSYGVRVSVGNLGY